MTQHLNQRHFSAQVLSTYDPTASIYYNTMTPEPEYYAYHHVQQQEQQLNYLCASGHIHPQHMEHVHRLQQLQQDALLQQQHAMYHQQMLEYQQQQQHYQMIHPLSPGERMRTKANKRAEHNANERERRENLNTKFQQLAHTLPNLQDDRRPSKGTIIERTLDFVKNTIQKEEKFMSEIRKLRKEQDDLIQQLYPGKNIPASDSIFSEDDLASSMGGVSPVSQLGSQKSSSCPSLELPSEESPRPAPTAVLYEKYAMNISPLNDVMFGHCPEQHQHQHQHQHQQHPIVSSHESDDDGSSSPGSEGFALTGATTTTSILTMSGRITDKNVTITPVEYNLMDESTHLVH